MSETYLGDVRAMSFDFAPRGWAKCQGQMMPVSQNQALYQLLGTAYGGNGQTTFALPTLAGVPAQGGAVLSYCICVRGSFPQP